MTWCDRAPTTSLALSAHGWTWCNLVAFEPGATWSILLGSNEVAALGLAAFIAQFQGVPWATGLPSGGSRFCTLHPSGHVKRHRLSQCFCHRVAVPRVWACLVPRNELVCSLLRLFGVVCCGRRLSRGWACRVGVFDTRGLALRLDR